MLRAAMAMCVLCWGAVLDQGSAHAQFATGSASRAISTDGAILPDPHPTGIDKSFAPASPVVTVDLSTALGDDAEKIRARLARYPFVRITQPADYTLTTKPEYTQTLMLVDGSNGESRLNGGEPDGDPSTDPRPLITLGNLALEDYDRKLTEVLTRTARAKALLAAETPPPTAKTTMCAHIIGSPSPPNCLLPGQRGDTQEIARAFAIGLGGRMSLAVRNTSNRSMYLYLLGIDPQFHVQRFALPNDGLIEAGAWAETTPPVWPTYLGFYHFQFVTIASATPIPSTAFDPWLASEGSTVAPVDGAARNWSISTFDFAFAGPNIGGVGNGLTVPPFSAPWAVQLYATVPYTEAQLQKDDELPPGTRKYLRQRSEVEREHSCGGTLIAENLVLTAAHCVASGIFAGDGKTLVFKRRRIRAGTHQLGASGTTYAIDGVAVHAGYQGDRSGSPDDIALLLLKPDRGTRPVGSRLAAPIAVASHGRAAAEKVAVYGWGVTAFVDEGANWVGTDKDHVNRNPDTLQFGIMQTLGWNACRARLKDLLGHRMLCAVPAPDPKTGRLDRPVFSCVGDSGGPLIGHEPRGDVLVGIVSWSKGCGVKNSPDVYTDVARYIDWVNIARAKLKSGDYISVPAPPAAVAR